MHKFLSYGSFSILVVQKMDIFRAMSDAFLNQATYTSMVYIFEN